VIVILTKNHEFALIGAGAVGARVAGNAAVSRSEICWAQLIRFEKIWLDLGKIWAKMIIFRKI